MTSNLSRSHKRRSRVQATRSRVPVRHHRPLGKPPEAVRRWLHWRLCSSLYGFSLWLYVNHRRERRGLFYAQWWEDGP